MDSRKVVVPTRYLEWACEPHTGMWRCENPVGGKVGVWFHRTEKAKAFADRVSVAETAHLSGAASLGHGQAAQMRGPAKLAQPFKWLPEAVAAVLGGGVRQ